MATLGIDIIGKDASAVRALKNVGDHAGKTGAAFSGMGKKIVAGFAGIAAVSAFKGFISEAEESRKVGRLTEQVIKSTGGAAKITADQVGSLATAISNKTGVDDEAIQSASNLLLTFTGVRNEVGKGNDIFNQATQAAVDMAATFGGDASKHAIGLGKALNDPIKGVTALGRVGVSFTQQQKDQIKTLVKSGKTLDAQKIILGELAKQTGGAAAATASPMQKLSVQFGNLKETIGTALLPVVDKFATFLGNNLQPALRGLGKVFKPVTDGIKAFTAGLSGQGKLAGFSGILNDIGLGVGAMFDAFKGGGVTSDGMVGTFERIGDAARRFVGFVRSTVLPAVKSLWADIAANVLPTLGRLATFVTTTVVPAFQAIAGFIITKVVPGLQNALIPILKGVQSYVQQVTSKIVENRASFQRLWEGIKPVVAFLANVVAPILGKVVGLAFRTLGAYIGGTITVIARFIDTGAKIIGWGKSVVGFFTALPGQIKRATVGLFDGVKDAFRGALNWIIDKWNGLEFTLPSGSVFGKKIGGGTLGVPDIPRLARGGITTGPALAVVGDNPGGREAIIPLPRGGGGLGGEQVIHVHVNLDGREIHTSLLRVKRTLGLDLGLA